MNRLLSTLCLFLASSWIGGSSFCAAEQGPNFVIILTDDQSWVGSSLLMDPDDAQTRSDYYRTPNIERLAKLGMRFTQGYSPAPHSRTGSLCTSFAIRFGSPIIRVSAIQPTGNLGRLPGARAGGARAASHDAWQTRLNPELRTWQSNRQGTRWLETTLTDPFSLRRSSPISVLLHGGQRLDLS